MILIDAHKVFTELAYLFSVLQRIDESFPSHTYALGIMAHTFGFTRTSHTKFSFAYALHSEKNTWDYLKIKRNKCF